MTNYKQPELNSLFKVERRQYEISVDNSIPDICKKTILLPACDYDGIQYIYYVNLAKLLVSIWSIDISLYISYIKNLYKQFEICNAEFYGRLGLHTSFVYNNKIYALPSYGNYIFRFDIDSNQYEIINGSMEHIYNFTNGVFNDKIYFTRWTIYDYFKRKNTEEDVQLDFGYYNIKSMEFHIMKSILGPESIHETVLSPKGDKIIAIEVPRYERDVLDRHGKTVSSALQDSRILSYNLLTEELQVTSSDNGPAHIVFDKNNSDIGYVACCNFSPLGCFGSARLDKYDFSNEIIKIGSYKDDDFYRIPNHEVFEYKAESLLATPVYSNQVHIINVTSMTCKKKVYLSKKHVTPDSDIVPYYYPLMDKTPYTVLPVNNTKYIIMCGIRSIDILDFEEDKIITRIDYNKQYTPMGSVSPLRASGHSRFA